MEQNNRYDRYRDEDNRSSDYNTGYRENRPYSNSSERNQGYQSGRYNQYYNERNNPDQDSYNRNRGGYPQQDLNRGDYSSGSGNREWGQYNHPSEQYGNRYSETSGNQGYRNYEDQDYRSGRNRNMRDNDRNWWDKTTDEVSSWFGDEEAKRRRRMDEVNDGMHRGKGPRNYTRSSEKIREDVCDILSEDSHIDASDIDVEVKTTEVILTGTVDSKMEKRRAEDLVDRVSGVSHVQNNLRVNEKRSWQENQGVSGTSSTQNLGTGSNDMSLKSNDSKFSRNANKEQIV